MRIIRIDPEGEDGRFVRILAINPAKIFHNVAPLGDPIVEAVGARAQNDISHSSGLLALTDRAGRLRRIPNVSDDSRAQRLRRPYPGYVNLGGAGIAHILST